MTKAFQCERCEEFNKFSGTQTRVGEYLGESGFKSNYDFWHTKELCQECKNDFEELVDRFFEDSQVRKDES